MRLVSILLGFTLSVQTASAASIDPELQAELSAAPLELQSAIITFDNAPTVLELNALSAAGIVGGVVLEELPMVLTKINAAQLDAVDAMPGVVSVYGNRIYETYDNVSRTFIGQQSLLRDRDVQLANAGVPVSGAGIGVAVIDTGIDATHNDLRLGVNVAQNVLFPLALAPVNFPTGFTGPVAIENAPMNDVEGGHGTFVAGNIGATGASSGDFYGGVAPGADLIGLNAGTDGGLSTFAIVQAYDYILANQSRYNIRVANNSFGSALGDPNGYDPLDPINVGSRAMHDALITVVFAAGNDGEGEAMINRLCVAPWVICVAAGEKEGLGSPAGFSSRGVDNGSGVESAPHPADPNQAPNLRPDITAPGANIISTRSKGPGVTNLAGTALGQDLQIPPAFLPFYTTSQGTSFASPHVAGVVALMLEANPSLTPQQVMEILRETAMPMPFEERVVGAGYVDAHNAVRRALNFSPVEPPAVLIPDENAPSIIDPRGDQTGLGAQDILTADFSYDASTGEVVYALGVADLSDALPNSRWLMESVFGTKPIYVSAVTDELGQPTFEYGEFSELPNGTRQQDDLGTVDFGEFDFEANTIRIRLSVAKINAAVGSDILGTTSTATQALAQITIGSSFTGGLLLAADTASGRDFDVADDAGEEPEAPNYALCADGGEKARVSGVLLAGESHGGAQFATACAFTTAKLNFHPGNQDLTLVVEDLAGNEVARANSGNGKQVKNVALPAGEYRARIDGLPDAAVDYVVQVSRAD